jgi:hypothetical protein
VWVDYKKAPQCKTLKYGNWKLFPGFQFPFRCEYHGDTPEIPFFLFIASFMTTSEAGEYDFKLQGVPFDLSPQRYQHLLHASSS